MFTEEQPQYLEVCSNTYQNVHNDDVVIIYIIMYIVILQLDGHFGIYCQLQ